jgi:hypothetical protein
MERPKLLSTVRSGLLPLSNPTKKCITDFAEENGMVYFGYVSQRDDDHHIVRGMTVSTKHKDDHYFIGTYDGYDTVFVERSDSLKNGKKHKWHIAEFDLKTTVDLPHVFIGSKTKTHGFSELMTIKYPTLHPSSVGATAAYPRSFVSQFDVYVSPAHAVTAERLITPEIAEVIASHFSGLVMEITEQALYVYSEKAIITPSLLTAMIKNGAWLATKIDEKSRLL